MILHSRTRNALGQLIVSTGDHLYWKEGGEVISGQIVDVDRDTGVARLALCDEVGNFTEESRTLFI